MLASAFEPSRAVPGRLPGRLSSKAASCLSSSSAVAGRSAGVRAMARWMSSSTPSGMLRSRSRGRFGSSVSSLVMVIAGSPSEKGGEPVSKR